MKKNNLLLIFFFCLNIAFGQLVTPNYNEKTKKSNADIDSEALTSEDGYLGAKGEGKYSIWYGCDINTGEQRTQVKKPFIWVEGINLKLELL